MHFLLSLKCAELSFEINGLDVCNRSHNYYYYLRSVKSYKHATVQEAKFKVCMILLVTYGVIRSLTAIQNDLM